MNQMKLNKTLKFLGNYWMLSISIILILTSISLNISNATVSKESIVLTFIGVLATFIVIGNYAQVIEIQSQFEQKIAKIEHDNKAQIEKIKLEFTNESDKLSQMYKDHENSINRIQLKILNDYLSNFVDQNNFTKTFNLQRSILSIEIKLQSDNIEKSIEFMKNNLIVIENSTDEELEMLLQQEELNLDKDFLAPIINYIYVSPIIDKIDILNGRIKSMRLSKSE